MQKTLSRFRTQKFAPIVFVSGKGGVGKTTVASALSLWTVSQGRAATFVEFADGESGKRALGAQSGVHHEVVKPDEAFQKMAGELFRSSLLAKVVTGNFAVKRLIQAAPALRELAQLDAVRRVAEERPEHIVFVDMPATGHGVAWLRAPKQLSSLLASGPLFGVARRLDRDLMASGLTSVVIVSLPERLVLEETRELLTSLAEEISAPVRRLVINRVPKDLGAAALSQSERLAQGDSKVARAAAALRDVLLSRREARRDAQSAVTDLLGEEHEAVLVPVFPSDPETDRSGGGLLEIGALVGPGFLDRPPFVTEASA